MPFCATACARIGAYFSEGWCSLACPRKRISSLLGPLSLLHEVKNKVIAKLRSPRTALAEVKVGIVYFIT